MLKLYQILSRSLMVAFCLLATTAWSQSRTITGTVTSDDEKESLPGVNILEKGTSNGTVTDASGNFSIQVRDGATLVFSFVGYASQEIEVSGQTTISVALGSDISTLSEVVVIGYGTVKKSDATGSLAVVNSENFNKGAVNSMQELISGRTAGVSITSNSGAPGVTSTIRIRGGASLTASNDPLIVIDGVPMSNINLGGTPNILSTINPADIESFTVLKDASATAIFGLRASNGVIMITTKRGGKKFKLNYNTTATFYTIPKKVKVYSGNEFRELISEQYAGEQAVIGLLGDSNTDWQNEIYSNAFGMDHNLTFSGTAGKWLPYRVSIGHNDTDGILNTYNFKRTTVSVGLDPTFFNDALKISINVKGMYNDNNFSDQGAIGDAIAYDPTKPVFNNNTRWRGYTSWTKGPGGVDGDAIPLAPANPVARIDLTDNTSVVKRSIGNIKFDYALPFAKGLNATLNLGYDLTETIGHNDLRDSVQWITIPTVAGGIRNPYQSSIRNSVLDFYLNYSKELNSIQSKIEVMGGYSWAYFYNEGGDSVMNYAAEATTRRNNYKSDHQLLSFFGRLNYILKDKYLFTATLRADATSRFSDALGNRWGMFPAVALAWKISEEDFLQSVRSLSELKLRVGYGETGQQDIVGNDYPYIPTYTRSDNASRYQFGNTFYNTLRPDGYDANIRWETTSTLNAGLDFGFIDNKITGSLDFYTRESTDLIAFVPIPVGTNFVPRLTTNIGSIKNSGVELNLNTKLLSMGDLRWDLGFNVTYNKNEITKLNLSGDPKFVLERGNIGGTTSGSIQADKVGYPTRSFYVYQQIYDSEGLPIEDAYVDRNGDGVINTDDLYIYKKADPTWLLGINSRINYKRWDMSFSGRANFGNYAYNNVASNSNYGALYNSMEFLRNVSTLADKTQFNTGANTRFSDFYMENAAFFRLDFVNVGHTFKSLYKDRVNIRVGAGVQNVFVITNYTGLDPEISGGLDNNFFPRTRSFLLTLNCEF